MAASKMIRIELHARGLWACEILESMSKVKSLHAHYISAQAGEMLSKTRIVSKASIEVPSSCYNSVDIGVPNRTEYK